MTILSANGIDIEYSESGATDAPAIVLIMGLGMQLTAWPDIFCEGLVARGFRVVRFDNRDVGLSTKSRSVGSLSMLAAMTRAMIGLPVTPPYTLRDMAKDTIGLMDALGIARAHIVGASMGGMIAQIVAAEYSVRVTSLVSVMSTSGDPDLPRPSPRLIRALLRPRPRNKARAIGRMMQLLRLIGSPEYPPSESELRARVTDSIDRAYFPEGVARQLLAIQTSGSRVPMLRRITAPTLVIHGAADPLVPLAAGEHTAANVSEAKLEIIPGMGHDLPRELLPDLINYIANHCDVAEAKTRVTS